MAEGAVRIERALLSNDVRVSFGLEAAAADSWEVESEVLGGGSEEEDLEGLSSEDEDCLRRRTRVARRSFASLGAPVA